MVETESTGNSLDELIVTRAIAFVVAVHHKENRFELDRLSPQSEQALLDWNVRKAYLLQTVRSLGDWQPVDPLAIAARQFVFACHNKHEAEIAWAENRASRNKRDVFLSYVAEFYDARAELFKLVEARG